MPVPTTVRPRRIDPRLLRRTRGSRLALAVDAALGIVAALLVLAQAVLIAHVAARSFDGAAPRALVVPLAALCIVVTARAAACLGLRRGRAAGRSRRAVRASRRPGQEPAERHPRRTRCAGRCRAGRGGGGGHRRPRDGVRALAATDGAGRGGAGGGAVAGGRDRPAVGAADAGHPAPGAGLHVADRPHHRAPGAGALAGAVAAVVALPRRRARPADAARLQPRRGPGGTDRPGRRALPQGDHGDAAAGLPVRRRARSGGHAGSGVDRGHRGSAARGG